MNTLDTLIGKWQESGDEAKLLAYMETPEYRNMPYEDRNRLFITSSKLKGYEECPLAMKLRYIDGVKPEVEEEDKDYFLVGRALDDRITYGEEAYADKYEMVARRTKDAEKIQLTNSLAAVVDAAYEEYKRQPMFPKQVMKANIVWLEDGYPCKAELDYLEEDHIGDFKLVANVLDFNPEAYLFQMSFYHFALLQKGIEADASLFVMDKHKGWSRSHMWRFSVPTLQAQQERIALLMRQYIGSLKTGMFPMADTSTERGRKIAFDNPYYTSRDEFRSFLPSIL